MGDDLLDPSRKVGAASERTTKQGCVVSRTQRLTSWEVGASPSLYRLRLHVPMTEGWGAHRCTAPGAAGGPGAESGWPKRTDDQFRKSVDFLFEVVGGW